MILGFVSSIGYIPSLTILVVTFACSLGPKCPQYLYKNLRTEDINLGDFGLYMGFITAVLLLILSIIYDLFTCDVRHSFAKANIKSRKDTNIEIVLRIYKSITVILFIFIGYENRVFYLLYIAISSGTIGYTTFRTAPYYNLHVNLLGIGKMIVLCCLALIFLYGYIIDSSSVIILLSFITVPLFVLISMPRLIRYLNQLPSSYTSTQNDFELKIRKMIMEQSDKDKFLVIDAFNDVYKIPSIKLNNMMVI